MRARRELEQVGQNKRQSLGGAFKVAFEGIVDGVVAERNMKIHLVALAGVLLAGWYLNISRVEWCLCIIVSGGVIGAELMNYTVEKVVDLVMPYRHPQAKKAKDAAAGSVLVMAIAAAIVGCMIFIPKLLVMAKG